MYVLFCVTDYSFDIDFTLSIVLTYDIILCYFTGIFYAVVRHISMLFTDNKDSVFCTRSGGSKIRVLNCDRVRLITCKTLKSSY